MNQSPSIIIDENNDNNQQQHQQQQQSQPQEQQQQNQTNLSRTKSISNLSRVSLRLDQTIKHLVTRINVANKLSMAKRKEENLTMKNSVTLLEDPNLKTRSIKKIHKSITPILKQQQQNSLLDSNENFNIKKGIISGGNLLFDIDYSLLTSINDTKKTISRPYIYLTSDVRIENIMNILFNEWKLSIPRIVLFLLSDPDYFRKWNNQRQISSFRTGIMNAAKTTSMWLVTNGLDIGIGKLIGDALIDEQNIFRSTYEKSRKNFPIIGITNDYNLCYTQEFFGTNVHLTKTTPKYNQHRYELNAMHTNFLLLQNMTNNSNNCNYNNLMINFIDYLTNRNNIDNSFDEDDNYYNVHHYNHHHLNNLSGDYRINQQPKINKNKQKFNYHTIINPSFGQKTNFYDNDQDDVDNINDSDDNDEIDSYEHSFISPEGKVINDNDHLKPTTTNTTVKNLLNEKMIPVVCLVIQGDYHCAKLVLDNIRRHNPIIVLRGSGGFADLLSYAYLEMQHHCRDFYNEWDAEFVEQTLKPLLVEKIVKYFPIFRNNIMARNIFRDRIIDCVRESGSQNGHIYLSILNMHNSSCDLTNLPKFILLSLFKSQHRKNKLDTNLIRKDLYLTIDWNCPLVALNEVLSRNPTYNLQLEKSIFELALLKSNREDFVDLFLNHGFKIHKYLTPFRLIRLIRFSLLESDFFRTICMDAILGIPIWSNNFDDLLERLSMLNSSNIDPEKFISNEFNQLIFILTSLHDFVCPQDLCLNIMGMYQIDAGSSERKALTTLAMWAIFNHRFKLAEILWKHSDQPIHLGLILSMILDRMTWFVTEQNIKDDLQNESKIFAKFSIDVLDSCYRNDEQRGYNLLDQKNSDWDQQTAVDIAANGSNRAFIAHPCCQKWLTNTFNGNIRVRELNWGFITISPVIKIILSAYFILPMYIWIRFINFNSNEWNEHKKKLLQELNNDSNDSDDEDEFMAKAADQLKLLPLNSKKNSNDDSNKKMIEQLIDNNQLTISSIDDDFRFALTRLKRKKHQIDNHDGIFDNNKKSLYNRERKNLFIDKQPPLYKMIYLLWNSPITKFWTYQLFYIIYLALLSLALIWPGCGEWRLDLTVCMWTFLNIIEHINRVYTLYYRYTSVPMFFRLIETILLIIFWLTYTWGRVLIVYSYSIHGHLFSKYNIDPYGMKVILSLGLLYFYYRLFYIYLPISPTLGPLLYRFRLMVSVDFIHFMRMAIILLVSSGIIIQSLYYPNGELSLETFKKTFHRTIVSLFLTPVDELTFNCTKKSIEEPKIFDNNNQNNNDITLVNLTSIFFQTLILGTESFNETDINREEFCPIKPIPMSKSCPVSGFWSYVFTFQFLICLKLILMTLLYALFASTAAKLQTETDNIWKFQRYILVIDFANRSSLHSPLCIFQYLYRILKFIYKFLKKLFFCCNRKNKRIDTIDSFKIQNNDNTFFIQNNTNNNHDDDINENNKRLTKEDYNYWRQLAKLIYDEYNNNKEDEKVILNKQFDTIKLICEELEHEKNILSKIKIKMNEFERMLNQTQINIERIRCSNFNFNNSLPQSSSLLQQKNNLHYLSRLSPYYGTKIHRFPIADKYVSWDINWINYDPLIYSRKKDNFSSLLKKFVDEDLLAIKERFKQINNDNNNYDIMANQKKQYLPIFNWNIISNNAAGLTIDRRSWIKEDFVFINTNNIDNTLSPKIVNNNNNVDDTNNKNYLIYKLDEDGLPLNIMGRTGLRGKGNLPRWGPNHYVMLIISRTKFINNNNEKFINEFILEQTFSNNNQNKNDNRFYYLPIRFIGDEFLFNDLKNLFYIFNNNNENKKQNIWNNDNDIIDYFQSIDKNVKKFISNYSYYMDSPDNTDNAWKEVKIYHFHFNYNIDDKHNSDKIIEQNNNDDCNFIKKSKLSWNIYYEEEMSIHLPMEQVSFIENAIKMINNWNQQ